MPKFSVYVPEALWTRVQSEVGELNMSQVVQRALQEMVSGRSATSGLVRNRPAPDPERVARIRAKYAETADRVFAEGYDVGMALAEEISADDLIQLSEWDFALADYELKSHHEPWKHTIPGVIDVIERTAEEQWGTSWRATLKPGSIAAHGAVAALRDIWIQLFGEQDEASADRPRGSNLKQQWEQLGIAGYLDEADRRRLDASGYTVEEFWAVGITGPWTPELVMAVAGAGGPAVVRDAIYGAVADAIAPEELESMLAAGLPAIHAAAQQGPFSSAKELLKHLRH